jgi:GntR family transcriptional regulator
MQFQDKQPFYLQIAEYVCEEILKGRWPAGERVPSVRDLALMMEVNPNTIKRSYEHLQNKDIIYCKRGLGFSASPNAKNLIIFYRKERFIEKDLPSFFSAINLLNISLSEIEQRYRSYMDSNDSITI